VLCCFLNRTPCTARPNLPTLSTRTLGGDDIVNQSHVALRSSRPRKNRSMALNISILHGIVNDQPSGHIIWSGGRLHARPVVLVCRTLPPSSAPGSSLRFTMEFTQNMYTSYQTAYVYEFYVVSRAHRSLSRSRPIDTR
jgi:hypothetical protein